MKIKIAMLVSAVISICALMAGAVSYSWFSGSSSIESGIDASAVVSYFGGGDGTKDDPYIIRDPRHLYNLSWLQNMGVFQDKVYYFKLDSSFSMPKNSAVPPIGTTDYPFMGVFDGNKQTISNLWVSSDPNDWAKKPVDYESISMGKDVGFFGKISNYTDNNGVLSGGFASNFYINNLSVTTNISDSDDGTEKSYIGLIAGNVNGSLSGIGVKDGKLEFNNSSSTKTLSSTSKYTLIGSIDSNVNWIDVPGVGGNGDLEVIPNEILSKFTNKNISAGSIVDLDSVESNGDFAAKLCGYLEYKTPSPPPATTHIYNDKNLEFGKKYYPNNITTLTSVESKNTNSTIIEKGYSSSFSNPYFIVPKAAPVFITNKAYELPSNCVWFKPANRGNCTIAFGAENLGGGSSEASFGKMAVYRYLRDAEGYIISSTIEDMTFVFNKDVKNGAVLYFSFSISSEDVKKGYEYAIGKDRANSNTNVGFLFLKLAGSSVEPGDIGEGSRVVLNVDYVNDTNGNDSSKLQVWDSEYSEHNVLLKTEASIPPQITEQITNYGATFSVGSDNKVYYPKTDSNDPVIVNQTAGNAGVAVE